MKGLKKYVLRNSYSDFPWEIEELLESIDEKDLAACTKSYDVRYLIDDEEMKKHLNNSLEMFHSKLRKWALDNSGYIDVAIDDGLCVGCSYHEMIQYGQYMYYRDRMSLCIDQIYIHIHVFKLMNETEGEK